MRRRSHAAERRARPGAGLAPALLAGFVLAAGWRGAPGQVPLPQLPRGQGERCVEPVDVMRREHMQLLLHQRDRTVHAGERAARHSLRGCVECHARRDAAGRSVPVIAAGEFCAACHAYAAVTMDCFECHAATPDGGQARDAGTRP